jgi:hypothetical protein
MTAHTPNHDRWTTLARWTARIIGALAGAYWTFALIASGLAKLASNTEPLTLEGAVLFTLVLASALGVLFSWRRERVSGPIVLAGGTALSAFAYMTAGHNKLLAVLVSGTPFLVAGALFVVSGWRASKQEGVPDIQAERRTHISSPRLTHPEQAVDFEMQIIEESPDANV